MVITPRILYDVCSRCSRNSL